MKRPLLFVIAAMGLGLNLLLALTACVTDATSEGPPATPTLAASPSPSATVTSTATATPLPNRRDCDEIRGTRYLSPAERFWYLANCLSPTATPRNASIDEAPSTATPRPRIVAPADVQVTALGDSVMLGAEAQLRVRIPGLDFHADVGTQASSGIETLRQLKNAGSLGETVVIHVGSNGTFTSGQLDEMMSLLADVERVLFVNVRADRPWEAANNIMLAGNIARYPKAGLIDWRGASAGHPEYFWNDGIHLRPAGAEAYADLITSRL